jgi:hypothetical protein
MARKQTKRPPEFAQLDKIKEPFLQRLYLVAVITKYLGGPVRPIVVGGLAVEFYTGGAYMTGDIDLLYPHRKALGELLESWGFARQGRLWSLPEAGLWVEVPGEALGPDEDPSRVIRVRSRGLTAEMIGLEDLIVDRLNAYVHWKSDADGLWAESMMAENADVIDWAYLRRRARKEGTAEALARLRRRIGRPK